jgi:hypothetical protein
MFSWKEHRAQQAAARQAQQEQLGALALEAQRARELLGKAVQVLLVLAREARTLRQVAAVLQVQAQLPLAPAQDRALRAAALQALAALPHHGPSSRKSTRSRTTRAKSTAKHRRRR